MAGIISLRGGSRAIELAVAHAALVVIGAFLVVGEVDALGVGAAGKQHESEVQLIIRQATDSHRRSPIWDLHLDSFLSPAGKAAAVLPIDAIGIWFYRFFRQEGSGVHLRGIVILRTTACLCGSLTHQQSQHSDQRQARKGSTHLDDNWDEMGNLKFDLEAFPKGSCRKNKIDAQRQTFLLE